MDKATNRVPLVMEGKGNMDHAYNFFHSKMGGAVIATIGGLGKYFLQVNLPLSVRVLQASITAAACALAGAIATSLWKWFVRTVWKWLVGAVKNRFFKSK